ncbi:MAG TPA: hypothetical protein VF681_00235 [Abditibacteriaceae bacterium]
MESQEVSSRASESRRVSWLRRGAPLAVVFGGVGFALASGAREKDVPAVPSATLASDTTQQSSSIPAERRLPTSTEFQKSPYSGVMVRNSPIKKSVVEAKTVAKSGWRYVRPGTTPNPGTTGGYGNPATQAPAETSLGAGRGFIMRLPRSKYPAEMHSATTPGVRQCIDPTHKHDVQSATR